MGNIIVMILAFAVLCGIALLFHVTLDVNMGEGIMLSAASVILLLFISSFTGTFSYGMYGIYIAAAAGLVFWIIALIKRGKRELVSIVCPSVVILFILYAGSLVLFHNDFIQHIDEFHQWAAAVKYMQVHDKLPTGWDFIGGGGQYGFATSLFHLFFQKISGYSEQNMYVSSALLSGIGFLLPFSNYEWKNWKKAGIYAAIIYIALFSLYMYGSKSLYVDIPVAAWAGGLAGWWINRKKKKSNILILLSGLVLLHFFKQSAGLLMAVFVAVFVLLHSFVIERGYLNREKGVKRLGIFTGLLCFMVVLGSVFLLGITMKLEPYEKAAVTEEATEEELQQTGQQWMVAGHVLPDRVSQMINTVQLSKRKAYLSLGAFVTAIFGTPMSSKSNLPLAFIPFMLLIIVLVKLAGELYDQKRACTAYIFYIIFVVLGYSAALFFSYLFMFAYELSINMRSVSRYFSGCAVYLFVIMLVIFLQPESAKREKVREYTTYGILFFFTLGLNKKFIPNATALNKTQVSGYEKINGTLEQVEKIDSVIDDKDKVYFICQYGSEAGDAELINAPALYYMDDQISNYLSTPWQFTKDGCNIRLEEFDITVDELPALLTQGGYTYVWIYMTDKYLSEKIPEIMDCENIKDSSLYQVVYENGTAAGLKFVRSLK